MLGGGHRGRCARGRHLNRNLGSGEGVQAEEQLSPWVREKGLGFKFREDQERECGWGWAGGRWSR